MRPKGSGSFRDKPIPVKLDPALLERIDALAKRLGEPRSVLMRFAMRLGLQNLENSLTADADLSSLGAYPEHTTQSSLAEDSGKPPPAPSAETTPGKPRRKKKKP